MTQPDVHRTIDALNAEPSLQGYHLLPSVRGDLLVKLGRLDEARAEFERAAAPGDCGLDGVRSITVRVSGDLAGLNRVLRQQARRPA